MGEISIRFRMNMETGKKDIFIDYESDEDAMRHEHEKDHKNIVQRLLGEGILQADEVGEVIVDRQAPGLVEGNTEPEQGQQQAQGSGG